MPSTSFEHWVADTDPGFDATDLVRAEQQVLGSFGYTDAEFAAAIELVGRWDLSWAASYPLSAGDRVFGALLDGGTDPVKALLTPD